MKKNVTVSVIVPLFNAEKTVTKAIESILNQSYPVKEIIVVDDGSHDASAQVAQSLSKKVKLISQKNKGAAAARNTGIKACSSEFIAFLDSDDTWSEHKLEKQMALIGEYPEIDMCFTNYSVKNDSRSNREESKESAFDTQGDTYALLQIAQTQSDHGLVLDVQKFWELLLTKGIVMTQTVVIRRSVLNNLGGFDNTLKFAEDTDLWLRVARKYVCGVDLEPLFEYVIHDDNMTHNREGAYVYMLQVLDKNYSEAEKHAGNVTLYKMQNRINKYLVNVAIIVSRKEGLGAGRAYIDQLKRKGYFSYWKNIYKWLWRSLVSRKSRV